MGPAADLDGVDMIVFDADNTLRRTLVPDLPCPHRPGDWELIPDVPDTLARIAWRPNGLVFAIASNQDHVGYNLIAESTALDLLRALAHAAIGDAAAHALIRFCPHPADAHCRCRKPEPGMLLGLCEDTGIAPAATLFVGDATSDRDCAVRAGTRFATAAQFFGRP
jgi:D-glycero-D-manno-heptose 1,7-bisphosphate phosphatase